VRDRSARPCASTHLYTGSRLLENLSASERSLLEPYLKVMDDHLYMPLRDAYETAANHTADSPALIALQQLLPVSTTIAYAVCQQICRAYAERERLGKS
jgi:hypothetical protein